MTVHMSYPSYAVATCMAISYSCKTSHQQQQWFIPMCHNDGVAIEKLKSWMWPQVLHIFDTQSYAASSKQHTICRCIVIKFM